MFQRMLARSAPAKPDAADLGTSFGLELSLDEAAADAADAPRAPAMPAWVQRLTSRPKAAR
jgi:hypothetical protein